jgi:hypothetical protein
LDLAGFFLACDFDSLKKKKITTEPLCLADEGSNSLRFALDEKNSHGFYGFYGLSRIKCVISVVKNSPLCLADEGSNSPV